jgi:hypothetical protein
VPNTPTNPDLKRQFYKTPQFFEHLGVRNVERINGLMFGMVGAEVSGQNTCM